MSNKSLKHKRKLAAFKTLILPPGHEDMRQLWILVRRDPTPESPGMFFVTHGQNYSKFSKRKGFEVLYHSFDRGALHMAANRATITAGPNYQPKFSAHLETQEKVREAEVAQAEREELLLSDDPGIFPIIGNVKDDPSDLLN